MARSLSSLALLVGSLTHTLVASAHTQPANSTNSPDPVGRIDRVESGRITHPEILVAHWAILDGRLQSPRRPTIGRIVRLVIEPIPDHAQLDSERQVMEVERIDLPLFLDVQ